MNPSTLRRWQILFYIAAFYNLSAAIPALLSYSFNLQQFFNRETVPDEFLVLFYHYGFWFSVLIFGIGYWMVARKPHKNHGILFLAILGKLGVGVGFCMSYYFGYATILLAAGGVGDIIFALLFCLFLFRYVPPVQGDMAADKPFQET